MISPAMESIVSLSPICQLTFIMSRVFFAVNGLKKKEPNPTGPYLEIWFLI
jgi:hypothetical protein